LSIDVRTDAPPALSVIVPCFNEAGNIAELWQRLSEVCEAAVGEAYEVIFVDDGSRDDTWAHVAALSEAHAPAIGVNLSRNYGHQLALTAGLQVCRGERALIIDADLQDPPELLPQMMEKMDREQADVVYGERIERIGESIFKRTTAALFYRILSSLTDIDIPLNTGDFRLISRRIIDGFLAMPEEHRFVRGMIAWLGHKQVPFPYVRDQRHQGTTAYTVRKMINFALDGITGFSVRPLRLALYFGTGFVAVAMLVGLWVVYQFWVNNTVPGWSSLIVVLLVVSAAQMLFLGLIGAYLGRIFTEVKRRPLYIVREISGMDREDHRLNLGPPSQHLGSGRGPS